MPVAETLINAATGHKILSFMDCNAGYNQIFMAPEDIHKTAFRVPGSVGLFEYVVMTFGLKNADATYQRAMNYIFHDLIGKLVEIYIDDVVVKSVATDGHLEDLRQVLDRTRKFGLRMNPKKCAFGVTAGQFLGFLVHERGIEIGLKSQEAVRTMKPPTTKKELQCLIGKINFVEGWLTLAQTIWLRAIRKGMELLLEAGAEAVEIFGDSKLVISQLTEEYKCESESLFPLWVQCRELMAQFRKEEQKKSRLLRNYYTLLSAASSSVPEPPSTLPETSSSLLPMSSAGPLLPRRRCRPHCPPKRGTLVGGYPAEEEESSSSSSSPSSSSSSSSLSAHMRERFVGGYRGGAGLFLLYFSLLLVGGDGVRPGVEVVFILWRRLGERPEEVEEEEDIAAGEEGFLVPGRARG
ncbi:hypothetical protein QYE76_061451 [Lolium multiflorum]|uniref:Reverse transcriptase domain-containing protein n=1 Tax=Lolium multiflorum TaxID=4521 RepID=A0AAD8S266_LOLMU|nr:hypothetical protein QYE76_061451 [Lolium multiflorum]